MLWGTAIMAVLGLTMFAFQNSRSPSGGATAGETRMERASGAAASEDARERQLKAVLARDPGDLDARLELARIYLDRQDLRSAWKETRQVLEREPQNPLALTYEGLVRIGAGQPESSLEPLQKAIATKPDLLEAYLQLAFAYLRLDRIRDAEATIAAASSRFPDKAASLQGWLLKKQREVTQERSAGAAAPSSAAAPAPMVR